MRKGNRKRFFQDQTRIVQLISSGAPLRKTLDFIMTSLERTFYPIQMYGSIMLFNPAEGILEETISSSLPYPYLSSIQPINIGSNEMPFGMNLFLKQKNFMSGDENSLLWHRYCKKASKFGFHTCWSVPILSSQKALLGMFILHFKETIKACPETIKVIELYTDFAVIAFGNSRNIMNQNVQQMLDSFETRKQFNVKEKSNIEVLSQLHKALEREEFEVYYQPYFAIENDGFGMEALIRWNHPKSGLLGPTSFLGIAEESGFILELENWVLNRAICDAKKLQQEGLENLTLSVNISAQQLENPDFQARLSDLLGRISFNPTKLMLEITERFLINKNAMNVINSLKESGVRISIDDFGTHYSSLRYLKDFPVDELKIDRSFISNLESDFITRKIVEMIIKLGHQLDLLVVAEGVESEEQFQLLKEMNCDKVQGFLYCQPVSLEIFRHKYSPKLRTKYT